MADKLFVYGTLHPASAPREIADLVRRFRPVGEGMVRGRLYDLGAYPAMVLDRHGDLVRGHVFLLPASKNVLSRLDAYEEYSPSDPEDSLFLRQKTTVALEDGSTPECWVYVYNRSLRGHRRRQQLASVA